MPKLFGYYLPTEIHLAIFKCLFDDGCSVAPAATVSQEWQSAIEEINFSRIRLTPARLESFDEMTRRNRHLVSYIYFCLEVDEYDCADSLTSDRGGCEPQEIYLRTMSMAEETLITTGIEQLLSSLSDWTPNGNLELDISIYSLSDAKHWFKYLTFEPDVPDKYKSWLRPWDQRQPTHIPVDDEDHNWVDGKQHSRPPVAAVDRVFAPIMGMGTTARDTDEQVVEWWESLPLAPAVTRLLLRQQTRRRLKPFALTHLMSRLPRLQEMHFEPWREWDSDLWEQMRIDSEMWRFVYSLLGSGLKRLVIFENFNAAYPKRRPASILDRRPASIIDLREVFRARKPCPNIARFLARISLKLEHLSASFMVDASDFFGARNFFDTPKAYWTWPNLTWLALTSRRLLPNTDPAARGGMLKIAAAAAKKMPALVTMEIWNGGKGSAMLFKYQRPQQPKYSATIIRRGTWVFTLQD